MADKYIPLAEAFRVILRATWPQRPALADEIQSIKYFHWAPIDKSTGRRIDPEVQAADGARAVLRDAVVSQSIRLRGLLGHNLPADIEPMEVAWNGIHVFDNTMEVYGERGLTLRTYRNVHCCESDVTALIGPADNATAPAVEPADAAAAAPKRHRRYSLDDSLAAEGVAGILLSPPKWPNANQAAIALAPQTIGTDAAKVDRLGRKISKLLETTRNTPKD